jgi:AcrR family transcriptional regulator
VQPSQALRAPATQRAERKAATRARLLAAARALFVERGFDAVRPQDIARRAEVATGTFYVHFPDKRAAFLAFTEQAARELMERLRARVVEGADFEARLLLSLEALLAYSDQNPGVLSACFADAALISAGLPPGAGLRERFARSLAQGLREGMARGEIRADYDADVAATGIVGLVQHALVYGGERVPRSTLLAQVTRFCARALVPDAAPSAADESP